MSCVGTTRLEPSPMRQAHAAGNRVKCRFIMRQMLQCPMAHAAHATGSCSKRMVQMMRMHQSVRMEATDLKQALLAQTNTMCTPANVSPRGLAVACSNSAADAAAAGGLVLLRRIVCCGAPCRDPNTHGACVRSCAPLTLRMFSTRSCSSCADMEVRFHAGGQWQAELA